MYNWWAVFVGGGLGSLTRFAVSRMAITWLKPNWPYATFISNASSCLILGFVVGLTLDRTPINSMLRILLISGFCGGFSTFSAFSFETLELIRNGQLFNAFINVASNVSVCLFSIWAGSLFARLF